MIFISPKGMTVTQWFEEIRKRNWAKWGHRESWKQKQHKRAIAHKPMFARTRTFFRKIMSTAVRS